VRDDGAATRHGAPGAGAAERSNARVGRSRHPWLLRLYWLWRDRGLAYVLKRAWLRVRGPQQYDPDWLKAHHAPSSADIAAIKRRIERFTQRPRFSIILTGSDQPADARAAIETVRAQIYDDWELFEAGSVAGANEALAKVTGDFLIRLPATGRLAPDALYMLAEAINADPDVNLIYSDEDEINDQGRRANPHFKTDWNPDLFLSQDYTGNLVAYRSERVREAGGFRAGFAGAENYDLALRVTERVAGSTIRHVPFLLYHGRAAQGASGVDPSVGRRALEEHLARTGVDAAVVLGVGGETFRVKRNVPTPPPKVSLIIPTRDRVDLLRGAVESILARTDYPNYEIVVVDNGSAQPEALSYLDGLESEPRARVLRYDQPFNFSAINNFAARQCASPILGLLNNDIVVIGAEWLSELVSHAMRPEVGAVGAMLYYPDDTIQHAGIIVGYGGAAINCYGDVRRGSPGYFSRLRSIQNYTAVTAACLLTRADVFAEVGGLNETDLAVAFNDVDYCLRLRERGYLVTWTPYAELYHLESVSRGDDMARDKIVRFRAEEAYLARRWAAVLAHDPYYNPNLSHYEGLFELGEDVRVRRPWRS
jgi:GT2 family glycosyltransferase